MRIEQNSIRTGNGSDGDDAIATDENGIINVITFQWKFVSRVFELQSFLYPKHVWMKKKPHTTLYDVTAN